MRTVQALNVDGRTILIEVEDIQIGAPAAPEGEMQSAGERVDAMLERVGDLSDEVLSTCVTVYESIQRAAEVVRPDEVRAEFGLLFGGEAGVPFVAKGKVEASLGITLIWKFSDETPAGAADTTAVAQSVVPAQPVVPEESDV